MVEPVTQWLGSGFGQKGSTSNIGACVACAATVSGGPIGRRVTENTAADAITSNPTWREDFIVPSAKDGCGRVWADYDRSGQALVPRLLYLQTRAL